MKKFIKALFLFTLIQSLSSCKNECRDVSSVYDVYYQAVVYPEQFDQYVEDNQAKFDEDFFSCLDDIIGKSNELIRELEQQCDDTFISGSDFWHKCYDEISGQYGFTAIIQTIRKVTRDKVKFSQTDVGATLIISKWNIIGPNDYEYILKQVVPAVKESITCTFCEKKGILF